MRPGVAADLPGVRSSRRRRASPASEVDRLAADPGLDAEPAARHQRPDQRGEVGAAHARRRRGRRPGRGCRTSCPACPVSSIGTSTIRFARAMVSTACFQSMPSGDQARSERPGGGVVGHADPEGREVVRGPGALLDRNRQQVLVGVRPLGAARRGSSTRPSGRVVGGGAGRRERCRSWAGQSMRWVGKGCAGGRVGDAGTGCRPSVLTGTAGAGDGRTSAEPSG